MNALAITVHLVFMLYSMCHKLALCTGRQTQTLYPPFLKKHFFHWWTNTFSVKLHLLRIFSEVSTCLLVDYVSNAFYLNISRQSGL